MITFPKTWPVGEPVSLLRTRSRFSLCIRHFSSWCLDGLSCVSFNEQKQIKLITFELFEMISIKTSLEASLLMQWERCEVKWNEMKRSTARSWCLMNGNGEKTILDYAGRSHESQEWMMHILLLLHFLLIRFALMMENGAKQFFHYCLFSIVIITILIIKLNERVTKK